MSSPWKVSLHGGHSGEFCEHAVGTLREVLEAAVAAGFQTFGVSEHAPRIEDRFLYRSEREKGFTVARLARDFEQYAQQITGLAAEFAGQIQVLRGFEAEVVPAGSYRDLMLGYREQFDFEYMVGSVHYVHEIPIDGEKEDFERAVAHCGGLESLAVSYYTAVATMIEALRPEVVGHFDLIRKNAPDAPFDSAPIREAADRALRLARDYDCVLDLNTAGYRKGLGSPYPAPWIVQRAHEMRIGFCFGDDSHGPAQVGAGIDSARDYLLALGVDTVTVLTKGGEGVIRKVIPLIDPCKIT